MKPDYRDTLCLAFEKALVPAPATGHRWLIFNAHPLPRDIFAASNTVQEQGFRPVYLELKKRGADVYPSIGQNESADSAIVLAGRVRAVNEANMARAAQAVGAGGLVVVAGDKKSGIHALRKWVSTRCAIEDSYSKHHALCFWFRGAGQPSFEAGNSRALPVFSAEGPDRGSLLLTEFFSDRIGGKVADFGAGNGFLAKSLLEHSGHVLSLDLMEAEWVALEQARGALSGASIPVGFHWIDIASELEKKPFDWVIMNPPFHHGLGGSRAADPELGRNFIRQAASTLVTGGRLLMVANRTLPYEEALDNNFRKVERLADRDGYKVFEAVK